MPDFRIKQVQQQAELMEIQYYSYRNQDVERAQYIKYILASYFPEPEIGKASTRLVQNTIQKEQMKLF